MRVSNIERLQLAQIVQLYLVQQTHNNTLPSVLIRHLHDLHTLLRLANFQVLNLITELRKKVGEPEKLFRMVELSANEIVDLFSNQPGANCQLAYNILTLSSPPIIARKPKPRIMTELKLCFLQSEGVTSSDWSSYLRAEEGVLAIKVAGEDAQVLIGVVQQEDEKTLEWNICGAFIGGEKSAQLESFINDFVQWSKRNRTNWKQSLIQDIKKILFNLPTIIVLLELRREFKTKEFEEINEGEKTVVCKWKSNNGETVNANWIFNIFQESHQPKMGLKLDQKQVLKLTLTGSALEAMLFLNFPSEIGLPLQLEANSSKMPRSFQFTRLHTVIHTFQSSLDLLSTRYPNLIKEDCKLFIRALGMNWIPKDLNQTAIGEPQKEGIWIYLPTEQGAMLWLQEDGGLCSESWDSRVVREMIEKGMSWGDLGRHMKLQEKIRAENDFFEFKVYEIKIGRWLESQQNCVIYQFRSGRFASNQKYSRVTRIEDNFLQNDNNYYENYILLVRVPFDFTNAYFSAYKYHDGPKGQVDKNNYLREEWLKYKREVPVGSKLFWPYLAEAIGYFCRCFLVERVRNKIFSQEDRKANSIQFR